MMNSMLKKNNFYLIFTAFVILFTSCDSSRLYEENKVIENQLWNVNNKISFFEDELAEKENELKNMWAKLTSQSQINMSKSENDPNYNILKTIEKLNRLKQADILSDNEFETLKDKIINQI